MEEVYDSISLDVIVYNPDQGFHGSLTLKRRRDPSVRDKTTTSRI